MVRGSRWKRGGGFGERRSTASCASPTSTPQLTPNATRANLCLQAPTSPLGTALSSLPHCHHLGLMSGLQHFPSVSMATVPQTLHMIRFSLVSMVCAHLALRGRRSYEVVTGKFVALGVCNPSRPLPWHKHTNPAIHTPQEGAPKHAPAHANSCRWRTHAETRVPLAYSAECSARRHL